MLRAIAVAKKKNDRIDAKKIADCLRCDFLPECYMASTEIRERRRTLRYRNPLVRQAVQMKNKIAVLLTDGGAPGKNGKRAGAIVGARLLSCGTRGTAYGHSGGWTDHRADLGAGSWRRAAIFLDQEGHQLLRTVRRGEKFGQYHHAYATLETTQQTSADGTD